MKSIWFLLLGYIFLTPCIARESKLDIPLSASLQYVENKGQFIDQLGAQNQSLKFLIQRKGFNIHLNSNYFSYETFGLNKRINRSEKDIQSSSDQTNINNDSILFHRVDVYLIGANENPDIIPTFKSNDYIIYHNRLNNKSESVSNVYGYERITYKNIYKNIDLEFILDSLGKPEFQFRVFKGGNPSDIKLSYKGALTNDIINNKLKLASINSQIEESIPRSYLLESGLEIRTSYKSIDSNLFSYTLDNYDSSQTLIIDPVPERLWGTYYGGSDNDIILSSYLHSDGNLYVSGKTSSTAAIASVGSHQNLIGGNLDAFLIKFSSNGTRLWSTYYGGSGDDIGLSVLCDNSSNVYMSGQTSSNTGISTTGSHQAAFSGDADAFIVKFNSSGSRIWGTYYGGTTYEYGYLSSDGNSLYLAGRTESSTSIATAGAYQTSISGLREGFLAKFTLDGSRLWGTYIGGPDHEYLYSVKCDAAGNILLSGGTGSTSGIATSGAHQTTKLGGLWDTFLMKFNQSGNLLWGTYCGATSDDQGWSLSSDNNSNIYVSGSVKSSTGMSTTGSHQQNYGGGDWDSFLLKFNSNGVRQWGTYYGGSEDESGGYGTSEVSGTYVTCDPVGNVFVCGSSTSNNGISTADAYQANSAGLNDAYIVKFNSNGTRLWGTYYGGSGNDYGTSIVSDGNTLYITGRTSSTSSISSVGSFQNSFGGGFHDGFIVKLNTPNPQSITPCDD